MRKEGIWFHNKVFFVLVVSNYCQARSGEPFLFSLLIINYSLLISSLGTQCRLCSLLIINYSLGASRKSKPQAIFRQIYRIKNRRNMKFLTFEQIQAQLRLDDAQATEEHDLLELYGDAAEDMVLNTLNRTITDIFEQYGMVPKALVQAGLMLVAQSYQHREPMSPQNLYTVPYAFDLLLKPYLRLTT